uniref:VWFA domain-containing protein n=1 Tax=Oryza punctata TaxID=4537 RepID=A0A0E0KY55_ORYPU
MEGDKLEHVRKAMDIFIGMLASDDRLSIVSFDGNPERLMGLTGMSGEGQADARGKIAALKAGGSTNMAAALSAGAEILRDRAEGKRRVGCMIFLSDGDSKEIYNKHINNDYPVHTFGLGGDHNPHVLHHIADKTLGTYSYVNNDVADIHGALKQFISDLTTVVAMDVEIAVEAHDGVSISSIHSGGYKVFVDPERRRGKIYINEMYAGEIKCFIVYLTVAEGSQEKLLTLHGVYQQSGAEKKSRDKLVVVRRSTATATAEVAAADELLAELTRIKLYDGIKKMVEEGEQGKEAVLTGDKLQDLWVKVKEDSAGVPAVKLTELESDIDMMKKGIEESKDHRESGLPYMLSWLTCHKWQRATIKDSPSNSTTFKVTKPDAPGLVLRLTTTPWRKTMTTWWSRYALSCGWFMLAAVFLYFAVAGAVLMLNSRWSTGRMVAGNATLDITGHAGWAKMEEDLHGMLTKAKADGETGSLFHHTTYSEINIHDEIKRYLYMVIINIYYKSL